MTAYIHNSLEDDPPKKGKWVWNYFFWVKKGSPYDPKLLDKMEITPENFEQHLSPAPEYSQPVQLNIGNMQLPNPGDDLNLIGWRRMKIINAIKASDLYPYVTNKKITRCLSPSNRFLNKFTQEKIENPTNERRANYRSYYEEIQQFKTETYDALPAAEKPSAREKFIQQMIKKHWVPSRKKLYYVNLYRILYQGIDVAAQRVLAKKYQGPSTIYPKMAIGSEEYYCRFLDAKYGLDELREQAKKYLALDCSKAKSKAELCGELLAYKQEWIAALAEMITKKHNDMMAAYTLFVETFGRPNKHLTGIKRLYDILNDPFLILIERYNQGLVNMNMRYLRKTAREFFIHCNLIISAFGALNKLDAKTIKELVNFKTVLNVAMNRDVYMNYRSMLENSVKEISASISIMVNTMFSGAGDSQNGDSQNGGSPEDLNIKSISLEQDSKTIIDRSVAIVKKTAEKLQKIVEHVVIKMAKFKSKLREICVTNWQENNGNMPMIWAMDTNDEDEWSNFLTPESLFVSNKGQCWDVESYINAVKAAEGINSTKIGNDSAELWKEDDDDTKKSIRNLYHHPSGLGKEADIYDWFVKHQVNYDDIFTNNPQELLPKEFIELLRDVGSIFWARGPIFDGIIKKELSKKLRKEWSEKRAGISLYEMPTNLSPELLDAIEKIKEEYRFKFAQYYLENMNENVKNALGKFVINKMNITTLQPSNVMACFVNSKFCVMIMGTNMLKVYNYFAPKYQLENVLLEALNMRVDDQGQVQSDELTTYWNANSTRFKNAARRDMHENMFNIWSEALHLYGDINAEDFNNTNINLDLATAICYLASKEHYQVADKLLRMGSNASFLEAADIDPLISGLIYNDHFYDFGDKIAAYYVSHDNWDINSDMLENTMFNGERMRADKMSIKILKIFVDAIRKRRYLYSQNILNISRLIGTIDRYVSNMELSSKQLKNVDRYIKLLVHSGGRGVIELANRVQYPLIKKISKNATKMFQAKDVQELEEMLKLGVDPIFNDSMAVNPWAFKENTDALKLLHKYGAYVGRALMANAFLSGKALKFVISTYPANGDMRKFALEMIQRAKFNKEDVQLLSGRVDTGIMLGAANDHPDGNPYKKLIKIDGRVIKGIESGKLKKIQFSDVIYFRNHLLIAIMEYTASDFKTEYIPIIEHLMKYIPVYTFNNHRDTNYEPIKNRLIYDILKRYSERDTILSERRMQYLEQVVKSIIKAGGRCKGFLDEDFLLDEEMVIPESIREIIERAEPDDDKPYI